MQPLSVRAIAKTFVMHLRDGLRLPVFAGLSFDVGAGECLVLGGPSGVGKSSILKMLYGNYAVDNGQILVSHEGRTLDMATASPRNCADQLARSSALIGTGSNAGLPVERAKARCSSAVRWPSKLIGARK